ncbi:MAG TPA: hypothetical protein PKK12_03265 [Candidatus Aminicenantes bacterium]|nr:hypothetical protein [Candidatus Aminicenantes bacterium]
MTSRKRFSETEILQILAEAADRQTTLPLLKKYGISATTLRRWRLEHAVSPNPPPPPCTITKEVEEADASASTEVVPAQFIDPEAAPPAIVPSSPPSEPPAPPPVSAEVWRRPARPAGRMKRSPAPGPWSQGAVLGLLVGLVLVLSWTRCQTIHRLILLIGPVGAFVAMIVLVTPFSMLLVRQFRRAWWQSCLDRLREGNGLVLFLTIVTLIVLDLAVLTLPSLICYLGNLVRTLFGL